LAEADERVEMCRGVATVAFPGSTTDGSPNSWVIGGERVMRFTSLVKFWAEWRGDGLPGDGVYSTLSLWTHPQTWVALDGLSYDDDGEPTFSTDPATLHWIGSVAGTAWFNGATLLVSYHGWDVVSELTQFAQRLDALRP
jgi:hypothetical protein